MDHGAGDSANPVLLLTLQAPSLDLGDALPPTPMITPRGDLLPPYMLAPRQ